MNHSGVLKLRDREFAVKRSYAGRSGAKWWVEVECERQVHDGEWWEPRLYHQGLLLAAASASELPGTVTSWSNPNAPDYPHPEIGALYVFGHHLVEDSKLEFHGRPNGSVSLVWRGSADVLWDDEFGERVPFECESLLEVEHGEG